ncbi:MAG: hypothetical protein HYX74_03460, partial [Acidobacteria bacterium]|nr:hypothetical protein [Acidobacteriota bacterium]
FEWLGAGSISSADPSATVHCSRSTLKRVLFGFNDADFCVRFDLADAAAVAQQESQWKFEVCFQAPERKVEITGSGGFFLARLVQAGKAEPLPSFSLGKVVELAIPLERLDGTPGRQIHWFILVWKDGRPLERWPRTDVFSLLLELEEEQRTWLV